MAGNLGHERNQGWSQGVGDKLAAVWNGVRLRFQSFVAVDDEPEELESTEQPELEEDEAFDAGRTSTVPFSTRHVARSSRRRGDRAPESPLPTFRAEFD
jgi:hypothetical protein